MDDLTIEVSKVPRIRAGQSLGYSASPHAVKSAFGANFQYDANGNQTFRSATDTGGPRSITYDVDDLATEISKGKNETRFAYGPGGSRFRRIDLENDAPLRTALCRQCRDRIWR